MPRLGLGSGLGQDTPADPSKLTQVHFSGFTFVKGNTLEEQSELS